MAAGTNAVDSSEAEFPRGISTADAFMGIFGLKRASPTEKELSKRLKRSEEKPLTKPALLSKVKVKSNKR
jgi:hypothetical protein